MLTGTLKLCKPPENSEFIPRTLASPCGEFGEPEVYVRLGSHSEHINETFPSEVCDE